MKVKVTFVNGVEKVFTVFSKCSILDYQKELNKLDDIVRLTFNEGFVAYDKILCVEEVVEQ